jgi:hypothetical protein
MFYISVTKIITFPETEHIFQKIFAMVAEYFISGAFSLTCSAKIKDIRKGRFFSLENKLP